MEIFKQQGDFKMMQAAKRDLNSPAAGR